MNEQRDREFVQHSIDTGLSSIQGDPGWRSGSLPLRRRENP